MKYIYGLLLATLSSVCFANSPLPGFQAGNILTFTPPYPINDSTGIASYYANGTSGQIRFSCKLAGDQNGPTIYAWLTPGKNFQNSDNPSSVELTAGTNGPFTWTLTNEGATDGNIKVTYLQGNDVTIQCQGQQVSN